MSDELQKKEKQPFPASLIKNIVLLLLVVFALLVTYKYIAAGIQENKEKAVIQERANVQQQADSQQQVQQQEKNRQLDLCINEAAQKRNKAILYWTGDFNTKNCATEPNKNAALVCAKGVMEQVDKAKAEEQVDKNDCYARYK